MINKDDYPKRFGVTFAEYSRVHQWIKYHYGRPMNCEDCGRTGKRQYDWANITGVYERDIKHFRRLCKSCHNRFDKHQTCINGHEVSAANVYIRPNGWKECRICIRARLEKRRRTHKLVLKPSATSSKQRMWVPINV